MTASRFGRKCERIACRYRSTWAFILSPPIHHCERETRSSYYSWNTAAGPCAGDDKRLSHRHEVRLCEYRLGRSLIHIAHHRKLTRWSHQLLLCRRLPRCLQLLTLASDQLRAIASVHFYGRRLVRYMREAAHSISVPGADFDEVVRVKATRHDSVHRLRGAYRHHVDGLRHDGCTIDGRVHGRG